jgi:tRNA/tmRNA/rRNA uracil-C5-methylase (TrmA/RlmC/RlmD family)
MEPPVTDDIAKGTQCTVVFDRYGPDGLAVGIGPDGVELHVAGTIRGERARVEIEHVSPHRRQAWARLVALEESSPHRTRDPDAPGHRCGGCPWSHLDEVAQREAKEARLQEVVDACGLPARGLPSPLVVPSPRPGAYRNRGKYVLARNHGQVVLGGYRPRGHEVVSTLGCPVMDLAVDERPGLWRRCWRTAGGPSTTSARAGACCATPRSAPTTDARCW